MSFRQKLKYFLVHTHNYSGKEATRLLSEGKIEYNGSTATGNEIIKDTDLIRLDEQVLKTPTVYRYYRFYKPVGIESTLNAQVEDGIKVFEEQAPGLAIAGRLDKASEGLLLISDDGKWVEEICNPAQKKRKTYVVELDREPDEVFIKAFSSGVILGDGYKTQECSCRIIGARCIEVILTEGKNRQIRRMCHKLGYGIENLKRIAIETWNLDDLAPLQYAHFKVDKT